RSRIEQLPRDLPPERLCFVHRTAGSRSTSANAFRAVNGKNARVENQFPALESSPSTQRKPATPLQIRQYCSFCRNCERSQAINQFFHEGQFVFTRCKEFHSQRALSNSGQHNFRRQNFGDAARGIQPVESCLSKHHGIDLTVRNFSETRVHISSYFDNFKIVSKLTKLRCSPQAAGSNASALSQFVQRFSVLRNKRVS